MHARVDVVVVRANIEPARSAWIPERKVVIVDQRIPDADVEKMVERVLRTANVNAAADQRH